MVRHVVAAVLVAVAAALACAADEVFRGDAGIRLGESVHASFPLKPPGPHHYTFFATAGTTLSATVRRDAGADFVPRVFLTYPGGVRVDTGRRSPAERRGARVARFRVRYAGFYAFEIHATNGVGGYTLTTNARLGRGLRGLFPGAPAGDAGFEFDAPSGARLSARVAPVRSGPLIEITGVTTPSGADVPVLSLQDGAAAEIRGVVLPEDGRFRLTWRNRGTPGTLRLAFQFTAAPGTPPVRELGVSDGAAVTVIERGDPALGARQGYVGSAACGRCHDALVRSWSDTAHNSAVRAWSRAGLSGLTMANDANDNGIDDFRDGLDLATTPAFAAYGANAPKLLYAAGEIRPYQVRIGGTTHVVDRTMGGNGLWRQRYLALTGPASGPVSSIRHPMPFEYDEKTRTYAAFRPEDWYDEAGNPKAPPGPRSFAAQCSGCHETGETLAFNSETGNVLTGYAELNIGCEQCHGPGAAHAARGDVRKILNPRKLLDQTAAGVAAANDVCARCHTKGESADALPGMSAKTEFAFRLDHGVAQAGDRLADFLTPSADPADFWGLKTNPLPGLPGNTSVAARSDRHEGGDIAAGAHAPNSAHAAACFDCHDPHRRTNAHQVVTHVDRGVRVATRAEDNSLCLACHAGSEPFSGTSLADAAAIRGGAPATVARAVIDHMKDTGMPVREGSYDPAGTGVGRCTTCHMPRTPSAGAPGADRAGFAAGNLASHRFEIVWPNASARYGVTNSCNVCHPTGDDDRVGPILTQWATPAPGQTAFHGASPPVAEDGLALNASVDTLAGSARCVTCHTSEGFVRTQVMGETISQSGVDAIAKESVARDRGVTCDACHGRRGDGEFHGEDRNPLRIPKEAICATCHNARGVTFQDFEATGAIVRHPQREMIDGSAGNASPGTPATPVTGHSLLPDGCITCHYDADHALARHDFRPDVATCRQCHTGLATFDRPANGDYDGDGTVRGIQTEVTGLLDRLRTALLTDPQMSFAAARFDYAGATDHALNGASAAQSRAVFNWYSVSDDRSRGVHNAGRAVQLLQRSYRELTGSDVPGATLR